jgi:predicted small lipoprotein YifL
LAVTSSLISRVVALLVSVVAMTILTGCGDKGPTAAEAGQKLKTDISALLKEINAKNVQVTNDGTREVRCGKGKVKREYAVTAYKYIPGDTPAGLVNQAVGSITGEYKIVEAHEGSPTTVMSNTSAHTNVTLDAPARSVLTIFGSTDCLRVR